MNDPDHRPDPLAELGAFIREQRAMARMSLRRLSELAGISNPYLSQIERGLRRPSAEILQQIARGLRISAESLYVRAGFLDPPAAGGNLEAAIFADALLDSEQKETLVRVYRSFLLANGRQPVATGPPGGDPDPAGGQRPDRPGGGPAATGRGDPPDS
ncbi:MAG TPA: helix-turn-helix transcriptional regulator [Acidimicrobiales bacterium]|nr:helix-turn-helix transcriptional regulator [Acidimicrobiales bacterium]